MNRNVLLFEYDKINLLHVIFWYKVVDKTDKNNCDKKSPPLLQGGKSSHSPVGPWVCLCVFWVAWFIYVHVCFVLPWSVESFPFMFWRWRNKLKWAPSSFLLPPHYCGLGAGSIPFRAIVNNKQCEIRGLFIYVAGHPSLNRICTTLLGCIRLRNDLYCVGWGVKLYSSTFKAVEHQQRWYMGRTSIEWSADGINATWSSGLSYRLHQIMSGSGPNDTLEYVTRKKASITKGRASWAMAHRKRNKVTSKRPTKPEATVNWRNEKWSGNCSLTEERWRHATAAE